MFLHYASYARRYPVSSCKVQFCKNSEKTIHQFIIILFSLVKPVELPHIIGSGN